MKQQKIDRRGFLKFAACAALGAASGSSSAQRRTMSGSRPNILFILADDLSYRDLSCHGQKKFETPNLDRLALGGLRFTQAYSGAPECAPARGSLMTGMHMGHCRIRKNRSVRGQDHLLPEDVTVAEVLKGAGYATGFIGKWGIGLPGTPGAPEKQGFDFSYGFYDQQRAHGFYPDFLMRNGQYVRLPQNHGFDMERVYRYNASPLDKIDAVKNHYDAQGRLLPGGVADPEKAVHSEDLFQAAALEFIREHQREPFFLYYATQLPHGPCITPNLGAFKDKDWPLKNKEWAAMVTHLDRGVGKMLALLEALGLRGNTVVFFAGDNGYSQYGYFKRPKWEDDPIFHNKGPWRSGKFICHEGGLRVPFSVNWPGRIAPRESDHICALYDFLATAADLAGVKNAPKTDGLSLAPELENDAARQQQHAYLYWEKDHEQAVRMGPWRAWRPHPAKPSELYRIEEDVASLHDVAQRHPDIVARIERIFVQAREDSPWYINPGEDSASIARKKERGAANPQIAHKANTSRTWLPAE